MAEAMDCQAIMAQLDSEAYDVTISREVHFKNTKEAYEKYNGSSNIQVACRMEKGAFPAEEQLYEKETAPSNVEMTWRLARATFKVAAAAEIAGDKSRQKQYLLEAEEWARKAVSLDSENADSHIWYATVCGKLCDFLSAKERIIKGKECQVHLDEAIRLRADDFITYYTYGRWCFEVASLTWVERKIATVIFDAPPESSFQDALDKFMMVKKLIPDWRANEIWIAKCYVAMKEYAKAIESAEEAATLPSRDEEDIVSEKDLQAIRKKYASYKK